MALDIYAAKDLNHAFEIASMDSEKRMEDHEVSEPEEIGDFLYDIRNELTNYTCYTACLCSMNGRRDSSSACLPPVRRLGGQRNTIYLPSPDFGTIPVLMRSQKRR